MWALIYLPSLGVRDATRNECRRILPAVTMLETGDWSTPMLSGKPYRRKPPMMNWMIASIFKFTGSRSVLTARLASTLVVLALALAMLFMPSGLLDLKSRLVASTAFVMCFGMMGLGRNADIDPSYVCATGFAVLLWLEAWSRGWNDWRLWLPASIPLAAGMLLKGPLIFLFYYAFIGCVLHFEGRKKELGSLWNILSIVLALLPFLIWMSLFLQADQLDDIRKAHSNASTWYREISMRFKFGEITFAKWLTRVLGSFAQLLPWILVFPLLWIKPPLARLKPKPLVFAKAARFAGPAILILIDAMPATKARYSAPLIPLVAIAAGLIIPKITIDVKWETVVKKITAVFFVIAFAISSLLLLAALVLRTISIDKVDSLKTRMFAAAFESIPLGMILATVAIAAVAFFLFRNKADEIKGTTGITLTVVFTAALFINIFLVFFKPLTGMSKHYARETATEINTFTPEGATVCGVDYVGEEPFIVHLKRKWIMIDKLENLKKPATVFVLADKFLDDLSVYKRKHSMQEASRKTIKYKKRHFYNLVRLRPKDAAP